MWKVLSRASIPHLFHESITRSQSRTVSPFLLAMALILRTSFSYRSDRRAVRASIASLRIQHSWLRSNRKLKYLIARSLVWRITENLNVSNNPPRLVFLICQFFFPRLDSSIHGFALSPPCVLSQTASNLSRITSQTCPRPRRLAANAAVLNLDACKCLRLKISPVVISRKRCSNSLRSRPRAKRLILDRRRLSRCF